jgi:hypothetical protein
MGSKIDKYHFYRLIPTILFLIIPLSFLNGQIANQDRFVQVSGMITDVSNRPLPGVAVISVKLRRGTLSEQTGIYSITSIPGDTILFRALGFKKYHTIIPPDFEERHANFDIVLETDTIQIAEVTILPWKTYSDFIRDMTKKKEADPIIKNMNDNLASIYVAIARNSGYKSTPEAGFQYAMQQNFNAMTTRNQYPFNNLLNPLAWAKFIDGVKHGMLKNQKVEKPVKPVKSKVIKKKNRKSGKK